MKLSTSLQHHQPYRSHWRITQPCRRFWCCSPACVKYLPSLRCSSFRLNTNCNVCSGSFNSHGSAHLDRQSTTWVSVLSTSLTLIPQDRHLDSSSSRQERNLDSIHTTSNTPRGFLDREIASPWILCSHCLFVTMHALFISIPLSGIGSLELRVLLSESRCNTASASRFTPYPDA